LTNTFTQQEEQILEKGFEEIAQIGAKSFTVESLAGRLGMSKKLYINIFQPKKNSFEKLLFLLQSRLNQSLTKSVRRRKIQLFNL